MYRWHYYDLVLATIALSLCAGVAVGLLTPVPVPVAVVAFGALAVLVLAHALFVRGPVDSLNDLSEPVDRTE